LAAAQFFQAADQIVVLGDQGIKEQGTWQDIKVKTASITKFISGSQGKGGTVLTTNFNKLGAQFRAKEEAEVDLSRQTGDLGLYGIIRAHNSEHN
jgi:ATP-binding cassette subfamily C (CFTR/MRP) protein 1